MNDFFINVCLAGLKDGFNPIIFMACAIFMAYGQWIILSFLPILFFRIVFGVFYAASILVFNFGPAQVFVLEKNYVVAAKILCFILGIWALVIGFIFLKDWFLLNRGVSPESVEGRIVKIPLGPSAFVYFTAVILGMLALVILTPLDQYVVVLGNAALLKGQWQRVMPLLVSYVITVMWPLWVVWIILSIKNLRLSMLKIVCASIFFTASSFAVLIFKK